MKLFNIVQSLFNTLASTKSTEAEPIQQPQEEADRELVLASRGGRAPSGRHMPRNKRPRA